MEKTVLIRRFFGTSRRRAVIAAAAVLIATFILCIAWRAIQKETILDNEKTLLRIGMATISVEIADTQAEQTQGLSGRASLGANEGVLFVFDKSDYYGFWMKDMLFPIDIIWIDEHMRVIGTTKNISPDTYPNVFYPPAPSQFVLETALGALDPAHIRGREKVFLSDMR